MMKGYDCVSFANGLNGGYIPVSVENPALTAPTIGYHHVPSAGAHRAQSCDTIITYVDDTHTLRIRPACPSDIPSSTTLNNVSDISLNVINNTISDNTRYAMVPACVSRITPSPQVISSSIRQRNRHYVGRHWHSSIRFPSHRMSVRMMFMIATAVVGTISFTAGVLTAVVRFVASN